MDRKSGALIILPALLGTGSPAYSEEPSVTASRGGVFLASASAPHSGQPKDSESVSGATSRPRSAKKWEFATIGYIFFAGAHGETTPRDPLPPVDLHLSFGDVLSALKFAFMGAAEARKDRLVFLGDLMWVHLGEGKGLKVRNASFADVRINSKTTAITALGGYRIVSEGPVLVDMLAGGRLNGNRQRVDYRGIAADSSASVSKTWIDPIIASRITAPLGGKFGLSIYGDVGGFGIGSKLTWQGIATGTYKISHKMTAGLGWRYFKINYRDNDGFRYDVAQSGPVLTLRTVL